jgi:hypothetical protein
MLLGIGLLRAVVLPHIYTCPESANCSGSFDPDRGDTRQLLQTFTIYWIKVGLIVSSVRSSEARLLPSLVHSHALRELGQEFDLCLGAIRGSIYDTALLLVKKNNHILSVFVFALLGISTAITLIVGLSISAAPGTQCVMFTYNATIAVPR